jgi:4-hydroxy-tetrahydrodipicolinate synthase
MADLRGINVAMQTPFDEEGKIDFAVFEELVERYVEAGVHGLVFGAGTGQHPYLTEAECNQLYEMGIRRVAGRCNVICQTSALNVDEVVRRSKHAEAIGADAVMILPPYLEGPTDDDGIFAFYAEIDAAIGIDIVGYNIPQATGVPISPGLLRRLVELPHFNYVKDSSGDFTTHQEFLQITTGVLNGADTVTVQSLMAGCRGVIWGAANYMPREAVALFDHVEQGRYAEALALWRRMFPSLLFLWRTKYVPAVVRAAQLRGFGTGNVRKPLTKLTPAQDAELRAALAHLES